MIIELRPATADDRAFVERTYFDTQRWLIEALFGWRGDDAERAKFAEHYNAASTRIIVLNGQDVGWITVEHPFECLDLEGIYIVPSQQRRGIGSALIRSLIADANARGVLLRLSTAKINPARKLYERLGFVVASEDRYKVYMEHRAPDERLF